MLILSVTDLYKQGNPMRTEEFKRKLTAILSADVAGYSKLMGDDEAATVKTLETYKGVMFSLIRQHRGRVVDSPGDNLLADFGSVVDAVQCGVSIQKELQTRNADLPENRRMVFRIGINLGDVIEEEDRIYGDGVNIAARLEALADPGGICISKTAFFQIESKLPLNYEFLGDQTVKNIAKPVGAYKVLMETRVVDAKTKRGTMAVSFWQRKSVLSIGIIIILAIAVGLYWSFYPSETSIDSASVEPGQTPAVEMEEAPKTIAVLPFTDLSPEKDQEYFVDGLTVEISDYIGQIPDLNVTGRTSSFTFKDSQQTVQEISAALGVEYILAGDVRKAGDNLRINAQLLKGADGFEMWSDRYDSELKDTEDIYSIQENIAKAVANQLKMTLGVGGSLKQLGGTDNIEAYDFYLVALSQDNAVQYNKALETIDRAIESDAEFALAWAKKAEIHWHLTIFGPSSQAALQQKAGLSAAQRAIELEPNLMEAYLSLSCIKASKGDFLGAGLSNLKALELRDGPISAKDFYIGDHYCTVGYFKRADEIFEGIKRNDPFNQLARAEYFLNLGFLGLKQRAYDEYEKGRALFGDQWSWGDSFISMLRIGSNEIVSTDDLYWPDSTFDGLKLDSPNDVITQLRRIYNERDKLSAHGALTTIMVLAANFGDAEFAIEVMEKEINIEATSIWWAWLPAMRDVRQLPRFKELVREIGLVDYWEKFGWPDICRPLGDGDFECD